MAHTVNFNMKSYDLIYTDIRKILHGDDLSFVNVETPVCDSLELSTYPRFNVHTPYLRAAAEAGFDILSLANNHTNDQQTTGIDGTLQAVRTVQKERNTLDSPHPPLAFSGLKDTVDVQFRLHASPIEAGIFSIAPLRRFLIRMMHQKNGSITAHRLSGDGRHC